MGTQLRRQQIQNRLQLYAGEKCVARQVGVSVAFNSMIASRFVRATQSKSSTPC